MTDTIPPAAPQGPAGLPPIVFPPPAGDAKKSGCLSWGLIGCAGASVVVIVGLVVLMSNARSMMGWALGKLQDSVLMGCTVEVTPAEREEFRQAFRRFSEAAKEGKITPSGVQEVQEKVSGAAADGKITPEEIRDLSAALKKAAP
ncbi:MAG TPA: hypothetical protein PLB02_01415 [Thermoanaerobaculia bacterium]|nr:hypothetical protein [Thermoanaerobaculia bacterium]HQR66028.1 hypothetical protein [Thermoanaerobaculia bacterium]